MADPIAALRLSHDRLAALAAGLTPERAVRRAYPTKWSLAQVYSHLGSGAEIMALVVDAGIEHTDAPGREANPPIWDRWNAKEPWRQVTDALESDRALVNRFESLDDEQRARLRFASFMGEVDAARLATQRLSEHAVHTWDIAVALDPMATIGPESVGIVVDNLEALVGFAGKSQGIHTVVRVATTDPARVFTLTLGDRISLKPGEPAAAPASLTLPAEAFIRLVYGRLDPSHTPPLAATGIELDDLRRIFSGF